MSYKEESNNSFEDNQPDIFSEIEEAAGNYVPLTAINLPKVDGEEDVLSTKWSQQNGGSKMESVDHFSPFSHRNDEEELDPESDERSREIPAGSEGSAVTSARQRVEQAMEGEKKKAINPRLIKVAVASLIGIVVIAIIFVSMKGEKRKSLFGKNKDAANTEQTSDNTQSSETISSDTSGGGDPDRRASSLKFGDIPVGSDPTRQTNGDSPNEPLSTEDAKKNVDNVEPYPNPSPTPFAPFMPSYSTVPQGGNQTTGGGSGNQNSTENTETQPKTTQAKINKNDLPDTSLGLETDENRFRTVLRAGQNNRQPQTPATNTENLAAVEQAQNSVFPRGTRLELILDEPIRSGIATIVTAKLKKGVANKKGEIIIPKDSTVMVPFSAEIANSRVFNDKQSTIQITTLDGRNFEVTGTVKDASGFAGLTGKITKVGGRSTLGKIGGALSRAGGILPGGQIITGTTQGIDSVSGGGYVTNATQIVEVPRGTSFVLMIGF